MGYFSNGSEGYDYEEKYCLNCIHYGKSGLNECIVWTLQQLNNTEACHDDNHIINALIPRSKDHLTNEQCSMFIKI